MFSGQLTYIARADLRFGVLADFSRAIERRRGSVQEVIRLRSDLRFFGFVVELKNVIISLIRRLIRDSRSSEFFAPNLPPRGRVPSGPVRAFVPEPAEARRFASLSTSWPATGRAFSPSTSASLQPAVPRAIALHRSFQRKINKRKNQ